MRLRTRKDELVKTSIDASGLFWSSVCFFSALFFKFAEEKTLMTISFSLVPACLAYQVWNWWNEKRIEKLSRNWQAKYYPEHEGIELSRFILALTSFMNGNIENLSPETPLQDFLFDDEIDDLTFQIEMLFEDAKVDYAKLDYQNACKLDDLVQLIISMRTAA